MSQVSPKKALGQHFLVDRNVLGVIDRLAELGPDDVVLEVGPGLGVLTTFLADRVRARARDRARPRARAPLGEALGGRANVSSSSPTRSRSTSTTLDPPPTKLVANLPYNVATPLVAETLLGVPDAPVAGA